MVLLKPAQHIPVASRFLRHDNCLSDLDLAARLRIKDYHSHLTSARARLLTTARGAQGKFRHSQCQSETATTPLVGQVSRTPASEQLSNTSLGRPEVDAVRCVAEDGIPLASAAVLDVFGERLRFVFEFVNPTFYDIANADDAGQRTVDLNRQMPDALLGHQYHEYIEAIARTTGEHV